MFLLFNVLIPKHRFTSEKLELVIICYILLPDTREFHQVFEFNTREGTMGKLSQDFQQRSTSRLF